MEKIKDDMLRIDNLAKTFLLHNQGAKKLPVFQNISFQVKAGECLVLTGASGTGKSTLLRAIYANYLVQSGTINIRHENKWVDLASASPHEVLNIRKKTLGYVSQFLRVIPRISTIELVCEPLIVQGKLIKPAKTRAKKLLNKLSIPESLWDLPPATFSGGEQQRVNIARTLIQDYPILLLDEPTASLDEKNRDAVIELINDARNQGTAVVGIFHDKYVRESVGTKMFNVELAKKAA
ncbi:MAG: phosphonate C-P lyase system protein PhnL [Pseudomonadota bacterium]|jgi:alpha-D-ribose 1-methylphosphonate 5-triphosphate synthase subunit PhnL|nr:phosphonate C-P lyase system protein PhnL [Pseudomonadota bacterium]MEC8233550.1 phosphonate C-P lyase system protein PhnL [Pseudomonadota bacterium]MEC8751188.1 phosphonate C-P lyase system protein PhnL [Pseudomonadota bacterium]